MTNTAVCVFLLFQASLTAARFISHEVATGLKGGYQVVAADLNRDGKPDLIALAPGTNELVWYDNPGWQRHVILQNIPHMINCAAWDFDGDGIPEIALAYEFSNDPAKSLGIVSVLHHTGDPTALWTAKEIDRLPTSHRLRWADIDGSGKKVLINAPLTNTQAKHPEDRLPVPLVYYVPGEWKRREIESGNEGVQHGILISGNSILTASMSGLSRYSLLADRIWQRTLLSPGSPQPWPKSGSSDVAEGRTGKNRFIASIEPWHGDQVAVYRGYHGQWRREQIDDSLIDGHTIITADFEGNGNDSILAGARSGDRSLHLYTWKRSRWIATLIDEGAMAAAACVVADINGDGHPDFACISPFTQNLKWYDSQSAK